MHELSIAMSILESLEDEMRQRGGGAVSAVHVRVGRLSGVVPEALESAYEIAALETPFAQARLLIEQTPVVIHCGKCGRDQTVRPEDFVYCPDCRTPSSEVLSGRELEIFALELSE